MGKRSTSIKSPKLPNFHHRRGVPLLFITCKSWSVETCHKIDPVRQIQCRREKLDKCSCDKQKPLFNSKQAADYDRCVKEMENRPQSEIEERRYVAATTKHPEEFLPTKLVDPWLAAKAKFVKAYYHWECFNSIPHTVSSWHYTGSWL